MSENRSRYSSAPLHDMRKRPSKPEPVKNPQKQTAPVTAEGSFVFLQIILVVVLPIAFIVALFVRNTLFYWGFVILSLLSVGAMYLLKAFVPNARRVLGVIHSAMVIVILFTILVSGTRNQNQPRQAAQDFQATFSDDTTASIMDMNENLITGEAEEDTVMPGTASLAQQKLEQFMSAWAVKDYSSMVTYSAPNWTNQFETQRDAETNIFHLCAIRTPVSYQIMDVSGSDTDQTRTITMQARISKSDGKEPELYNFQILMIRANNEWYVDPNSISSSQIVKNQDLAVQTGTEQLLGDGTTQVQEQPAALAPVAAPQLDTVSPDTLLYYNQDGGEYYHIDPNCSSIGAKYKPLTATFYYRDVSNDTFKNLKTCPHCKAPARK